MKNNQEQLLPLAAQQTLKDIFDFTAPSTMMYHITLIQHEIINVSHKTGISTDLADACDTLAFLAKFINQLVPSENIEIIAPRKPSEKISAN